jgi:hypothetical protein
MYRRSERRLVGHRHCVYHLQNTLHILDFLAAEGNSPSRARRRNCFFHDRTRQSYEGCLLGPFIGVCAHRFLAGEAQMVTQTQALEEQHFRRSIGHMHPHVRPPLPANSTPLTLAPGA